MRRARAVAAVAAAVAAALLPVAPASAASCPAIRSRFATVTQLRATGGTSCSTATYLARVWIRKSERGDLRPVTRQGYRCTAHTADVQVVRVTCVKAARRVTFRMFIRNG